MIRIYFNSKKKALRSTFQLPFQNLSHFYLSLANISCILLSTASELYCFSNFSIFFSNSSSLGDLPVI